MRSVMIDLTEQKRLAAEKLELDRLQIYPAQIFLDAVRAAFLEQDRELQSRFINLAKKDARLARLVKDDLIDALLMIFLPPA